MAPFKRAGLTPSVCAFLHADLLTIWLPSIVAVLDVYWTLSPSLAYGASSPRLFIRYLYSFVTLLGTSQDLRALTQHTKRHTFNSKIFLVVITDLQNSTPDSCPRVHVPSWQQSAKWRIVRSTILQVRNNKQPCAFSRGTWLTDMGKSTSPGGTR